MIAPTEAPVAAFETQAPSVGGETTLPTAQATTSLPTATPVTSAPSAAPLEPCISTDGTFGVVSGTPDTDVVVGYMYEMETAAGVTTETIDSVILPQLEKAIVDSVLEEVFPGGCIGTDVGKRFLRLQRRLTVTGISMNPSDLINEECKLNEQHF